jgi:hypothetical protein
MTIAFELPDQPDVIALIAELDAYQDTLYPVLFRNSNWQSVAAFRSINLCRGGREIVWRCSLRAWVAGSSDRLRHVSNI